MKNVPGRRAIVITTSIPERQPQRVLAAARRILPADIARTVAYVFLSARPRPGDVMIIHTQDCPFAKLLSEINIMPLPPARTGRQIHAISNPNFNKFLSIHAMLGPDDMIIVQTDGQDSKFQTAALNSALTISHVSTVQSQSCLFVAGSPACEPFEIDLEDMGDNLVILHATSTNKPGDSRDASLIDALPTNGRPRHRAGNRGRKRTPTDTIVPAGDV